MKTLTLVFREVDKQGFEDVRSGLKVIETRAAKPKYMAVEVGDEIAFSCDNERFTKKVVKKYFWPTIDIMVSEIYFKKIMPRVESIEEMKKAYFLYPDYDKEIPQYGLVGFELQ